MPAESPTLSAGEFAAAVSAISSAFGDPTRRDIYLWIRESGRGVTVAEVAERFELHPNVARHHLDKLVAGGYVEAGTATPNGAKAGRPSKRYYSFAGRRLRSEVAWDTARTHTAVRAAPGLARAAVGAAGARLGMWWTRREVEA